MYFDCFQMTYGAVGIIVSFSKAEEADRTNRLLLFASEALMASVFYVTILVTSGCADRLKRKRDEAVDAFKQLVRF